MIISAKLIKKPRIIRRCNNLLCGKEMLGSQLRLYGAAETGDTPYVLYVHPIPGCYGTYDKEEEAMIQEALNPTKVSIV